jgi:glutamine amidotransferase
MCELFALDSSAPAAATFSFSGFSARGGLTGHHADGWGVGFHEADGCRVFIDAGRACDAPLASFLREHPIRARTVLAHVRKATQGAVALANCHPFQREWGGRHWIFCHNGDLKDFHPALDGLFTPVGSTDSERAFCWLLQELRREFPRPQGLAWPELAPVLARLAQRIATRGTFNMLLSDGQALYAHASTSMCWLQRQHPFSRARLVDRDIEIDLASVNGADDRMVLVATQPLTHGEPWEVFEPGEVRVFVGGRSVWWHRCGAAAQPPVRTGASPVFAAVEATR